MGEPLPQKRTRTGKFDSFKAKTKRAFRTFLLYGVLPGVIATLIFAAGGAFYSTTTISYAETTDLMPAKVAALKADVINQISDCERAGHTEEDGLIVFDSNARASLGVMQFQVTTVQHYEKALYGNEVSGKDAILIALDASKAKALATDIVFKQDGLGNWLNCANKLGLRAQVNAINKISN